MKVDSLTARVKRIASNPTEFLSWYLYQRKRSADQNMFLVTLNHAGTHWIRMILAQALVLHYALDDELNDIKNFDLIPPYHRKINRFKYNERMDILRIQQSHSRYAPLHFKDQHVILMIRDLRDTLVSHYKIYSERNHVGLSFSDYLRDENQSQSLKARIDFLNSWSEGQKHTKSFHLIKFEDLKNESPETLKRLFKFTFPDLENVDTIISTCLETSSINHMQSLEEKKPDPFNADAKKIRKGELKKYPTFFTDDDKAYFLDKIEKNLKHDFGYNYQDW